MKKLVALILVFMMALATFGCEGAAAPAAAPAAEASPESAEASGDEEEETE